jgi:4-hydroxymandelate oxidase
MQELDRFLTISDFEAAARELLAPDILAYTVGGAGDEITLRSNQSAFDEIQLFPRVLRDVSHVEMSVSLFGDVLPLPLLLAPTAYQRTIRPNGEIEAARGAAVYSIPYVVSTSATTSVEEISRAAKTPFWFQLYMHKEEEFTGSLIRRAEEAGCKALCVTVDTPVLGSRTRQIRAGFVIPSEMETPHLHPLVREAADPVYPYRKVTTWKDIAWLQSFTKLPILLKGILNANDAELAVQNGVQGIIVSNHGARNLDTVPATIQVLPEIVDRVAGKIPVLMDGGIRRGTDIFKCLAYGATAVLIGRPYLYGLAVAGPEGVAKVIEILRAEFFYAMALCGCTSISEINRTLVRATMNRYPGC